jgi:CitMHS family citrate-Mg2+:H+ or citrate-Ca2+:H+ symporter
MHATLGLMTILALLAAVLSGSMSPLVALIIVPTVASLIGGFGLKTGTFIVAGVRDIAPVAGMFIFAILYFGIMTDAGLLDPIIDRILRAAGGRPTRIVPGTALLALLVHLDGSGAVAFLVTIPAMLPMYERLGMDRRILACVASIAAGVNFLPWTGPMIRASAALHIPTTELFRPLIPVQGIGLAFVFAVAYGFGRREARRLGLGGPLEHDPVGRRELSDEERRLRRPGNFWPNLALTVLLMGAMVAGGVEPVVGFLIGVALALVINYPGAASQRARVDAHAPSALMMASILIAAGAFTGIMRGSGMLGDMARESIRFMPAGHAHHLPFLLGLVSIRIRQGDRRLQATGELPPLLIGEQKVLNNCPAFV